MTKLLISVGAALLAIVVWMSPAQAQTTPPAAVLATPEPTRPTASAAVAQTVPVTLTIAIPGPDGPMTVEVPLLLTLDIRIQISQTIRADVAITPSVDTATVITGAAGVDAGDGLTETAVTIPSVTATDVTTPTNTEADVPTPPEPAPEAVLATATPLPAEAPAAVEAEPTATPAVLPTATPAPVVAAPVCPDTRAVITYPGVNQTLSGPVEIRGTAVHERFQYYKVEYAPGADVDANQTFAFLADSRVPVIDGLLASFDSTGLGNGAYTIKLTVVDNTGNFPPPCTVSVVIQNP